MIRSILHLLAQPYVQFATFSGRARRAEFWLFVLSLLIIVNVTSAVMEAVLRHGHGHGPHRFAFIEHSMRDGGRFHYEFDGRDHRGKWGHRGKWNQDGKWADKQYSDKQYSDKQYSDKQYSDKYGDDDKSILDRSDRHDQYHQDMSCKDFMAGDEMAKNGAKNGANQMAGDKSEDHAKDRGRRRSTHNGLFCLETGHGIFITDFTFSRSKAWVGGILTLAHLVLLIPFIAVTTRRLHDTGRSGYWQLFYLLPLVGWGIMLVFLLTESAARKNKYGPKPF